MYFFNKKNNYNLFKNEKNIDAILEGAFLSMNSFISKAYFSVKPNSLLINLFFKSRFLDFKEIRRNRNSQIPPNPAQYNIFHLQSIQHPTSNQQPTPEANRPFFHSFVF